MNAAAGSFSNLRPPRLSTAILEDRRRLAKHRRKFRYSQCKTGVLKGSLLTAHVSFTNRGQEAAFIRRLAEERAAHGTAAHHRKLWPQREGKVVATPRRT